MDLMLPDMNGIEVCRKLYADPNLADVRVVMLTAYGDMRMRQAAREAGALDYWTKPFGSHELVEKVRYVLRPRSKTSVAA
jgi:DNA-binding response OmpR family regulator